MFAQTGHAIRVRNASPERPSCRSGGEGLALLGHLDAAASVGREALAVLLGELVGARATKPVRPWPVGPS